MTCARNIKHIYQKLDCAYESNYLISIIKTYFGDAGLFDSLPLAMFLANSSKTCVDLSFICMANHCALDFSLHLMVPCDFHSPPPPPARHWLP